MVDGKIVQGTTPQLNFTLPFSKEQISDVRFSFSQKKRMILFKEKESCFIDEENSVISLSLSQEETYRFSERDGVITLRMRVKLLSGPVIISDKIFLVVEDNADKVIME